MKFKKGDRVIVKYTDRLFRGYIVSPISIISLDYEITDDGDIPIGEVKNPPANNGYWSDDKVTLDIQWYREQKLNTLGI